MKIDKLHFLILSLLCAFFTGAKARSSNLDSLMLHNLQEDIRNLQTETTIINQRITSIDHNEHLKTDHVLEKMVFILKSSTFLVDVLVLFTAIAAAIATLTIWDKIKEAKEKIKDFDDIADKKFKDFEKEISVKRKEIEFASEKINKVEDVLKEMEIKLTSEQVLSELGFRTIKDLFYLYMDAKKEKEFIKLLLEKTAILNLYSIDDNERFTGITTLISLGTTPDIEHLHKVMANAKEKKENKDLAMIAITEIMKRAQKK